MLTLHPHPTPHPQDFARYKGDILASLKAAIASDPQALLPRIFLATFLLAYVLPADDPQVREQLEQARRLATPDEPAAETTAETAPCCPTEQERQHLAALDEYAASRLSAAADHYVAILRRHPLDLLALRFANDIFIFLGQPQELRAMLGSVMPHWRAARPPALGYVRGLYAFALEETGERARARLEVAGSLSETPDAPWTCHAFSHIICEESGSPAELQEGIDFLQAHRANWATSAVAAHLHWHYALLLLERGGPDDTERVLQELEEGIMPNVQPGNSFAVIDSASLLWRLELAGLPAPPQHLARVAKVVGELATQHSSAFIDTHAMMALQARGQPDRAAADHLAGQLVSSLRGWLRDRAATADGCDNFHVSTAVGLPVLEALAAFGKGEYAAVVQLLLPLRHGPLQRLGGSHAQRDVYELTLLQAAIRANDLPLALAIAAERHEARPGSRIAAECLLALRTRAKDEGVVVMDA